MPDRSSCELAQCHDAGMLSKGIAARNLMVDRPKYQSPRNVEHCRQFMPGDTDKLPGVTQFPVRPYASTAEVRNAVFLLGIRH